MAVIAYNAAEVELLARLMRAEAEGDGTEGMLMVGNVGVNRVLGDCLDFTDIRTLQQMVFQSPGGFEATQKAISINGRDRKIYYLPERVLAGERFHPASRALWFFMPTGACPAQWYGQWNTGRYKSHCFYSPLVSVCPTV